MNEDEVIFDVPGFKDTEGVLLEIVNQFCLIKIFDQCEQFKIVFVASENSIGDGLKNSTQNFVEMFEDIAFMDGCLGICITKVDQ